MFTCFPRFSRVFQNFPGWNSFSRFPHKKTFPTRYNTWIIYNFRRCGKFFIFLYGLHPKLHGNPLNRQKLLQGSRKFGLNHQIYQICKVSIEKPNMTESSTNITEFYKYFTISDQYSPKLTESDRIFTESDRIFTESDRNL